MAQQVQNSERYIKILKAAAITTLAIGGAYFFATFFDMVLAVSKEAITYKLLKIVVITITTIPLAGVFMLAQKILILLTTIEKTSISTNKTIQDIATKLANILPTSNAESIWTKAQQKEEVIKELQEAKKEKDKDKDKDRGKTEDNLQEKKPLEEEVTITSTKEKDKDKDNDKPLPTSEPKKKKDTKK